MTSTAPVATLGSTDAVTELAGRHGSTLGDILARQAERIGDRDVLRFVDYSVERSGLTRALTFAELDRRVSAVAAVLTRRLEPGARVAVLAPQGPEFVVGFLAALRAGLIAVPLFSPDLPGHGDRLTTVVADCAPALVLASTGNADLVRGFAQGAGDVAVLVVDDVPDTAGEGWTAPTLDPQSVAYLQYTSGSTRQPAGVQITHANVVVNAAEALVVGQGTEDATLVSWLPLFHDMGLVFVVGGGIVGGMTAVLLDPVAFLMKPARWLQQLAAYPKTFSAAPNFAFDFCSGRVSEADRDTLDLSGVLTIFNGAEPVQPATLTRFYDTFGPRGLRRGVIAPSYGLAEATVYVACHRDDGGAQWRAFDLDALSRGRAAVPAAGAPSVELVSCGLDLYGELAIADPATGVRCDDGQVGELWVRSASVGAGYWNKPEQTAEAFGAELLGAGDLPSVPWLRTGDLGVLVAGRLYVTGRIKDVLIIDGRNHYPQDLEVTVEEASEVVGRHRTAAFSVPSPAGEQAVVVAEVSRHHVDGDWVAATVTRTLSAAVSRAHGVSLQAVVLIAPNTIPRTTSGKIARVASRQSYLDGTLTPVSGQG